MKKLLIFYFVIICQVYQSQNYKITYEVIYNPDIDSLNLVEKDEYVLKIIPKSNESFFYSLKSDNSFNAEIYKKLNRKEFLKYEKIVDFPFRIKYQLDMSNWKLHSEKKVILEKKCSKATVAFGGREWVAWYTTELPFNDGPYKFYNLPGLILEIHSVDNQFHC